MFRGMRRRKQQMPDEEAERILAEGSYGVLALDGAGGCPYAVPMSYAYEDGRVFFHSAPEGQKAEAVARGGMASFCVVARDDVIPDELTTAYESVIAFGRVGRLEGPEKRHALEALGEKYNPGAHAVVEGEIERAGDLCIVFELRIEHLTGKRGSYS